MPTPCSACSSEHRVSIDQKIRSGDTFTNISLWLKDKGSPATRNALARHAKAHVGGFAGRTSGPRPRSVSFLRDVVDVAHDDLAAGVLRPSIRDAIGAQGEINRAEARGEDRDLMLKLAALLGGTPRQLPTWTPDPEVEALEAEFRPLLEAGD